MRGQNGKRQTKAQLLAENEELRLRLEEAEQTLEAIRHGEVDALVVGGPPGAQIYALTGAEHVYRAIVETMNEAALMVDVSGTILFCNQRVCDLMKTPVENVVGHPVAAFAARPQQPPLRALLRDAQAGPLQRRLTLQAADGTAVPVQLSASLLQTGGNKSICLVATDLTELGASAKSMRVLREHQQALEASELRFRTIFEVSRDAVVIADNEGVCVQANPAVQEVFGLAPQQLIGRRMPDFLREDVDFPRIWETLLTSGHFRGEMRLIRPDGQGRYAEAYGVAGILPGRHLLVIRDITERKRAEEALLDANERFQDQTEEVENQSEELRVQTEELRVANEELSAREEKLRAANEALQESEQRLRRFYESGLVGVMYWRMDGAIVDANDKFLEMTGYNRKDLAHGKVNWVRITPPEYRHLDTQSVEELKATGVNSKPFEKEYLRKDGTRLPIIMAGAMLDEARINGVAFVLDNTERKRAEEALRETRDYLDNLFRYANAPIIVWNPQHKITRFNHAFERLTGRKAQEVLGRDVEILFPPDSRAESLAYIHRTTSEGQRWEVMEIPILHQDGSVRTVLWNSANVLGPDNKTVVATIAQGQDITERKQAEEALRQSEEKFVRVFRSSPIGIAVTRLSDGRVVEANDAMLELLHFERDEVIGRATLDLGIWIDAHDRAQVIQELAATGSVRDRECRLRTRDGGTVTIRLSADLLEFGGERCMLSTLVDVTERKRAEEALRLSEEKFRTLHRMSPTAIVLNRLDNGQFLESNQAMWDMTGYTEAELRSLSYWDLTPIDYQEMEAKQLELLRTVGRYGPYEKEYVRKDGTRFPVLLSGVRITDPSGTDLIYSVVQDITEPKRRADALRESEERLKRAQEIAHLGSWELDLVNDRLSWSDEVYRIFGLPPQEFAATYEAFLEAVHPEDRPAVDAAYSGSLREGRDSYEIEHRIVRKSTGEVRIAHEKCQHVRDASGRIIRSVGMVHDITERKRAEEALRELTRTLETKVLERTAELQHRARQLQRLTLELSEAEDRERRHLAEILHDDLQQQLAAAKFHLSLLSNRAKHDRAQQMMIGQIDRMLMDAIQKSRSLSHELSPAVLYQGGLADALGWLAEQIKTKHGLEVAVDAFGTVAVESDALKTFLYRTAQELLFNVVKHARVSRARVRIRCLGRCICLSVSDRGRGFDPQGLRETAGFGLLSIRERVELLGGRMKIHSAPGHGATFHIVVPDGQQKDVLHREVMDGVSLESPMVAPAGAIHDATMLPSEQPRLRVLLADDHEIVREGLASLLQEEAGIQVVGQAANGREAVDLAARLRPDVVVMDVAMPLINGDEATRQIKMHLPGTRVVALSMYEEADLVERMHRAGAEGYVLKTAPAEELLAAIRGQQPAHAP